MAAITEAAIRELAAIKGEKAPITSCYLDVDGRRVARHRDLEHEVDVLLKGARPAADGDASVHRRPRPHRGLRARRPRPVAGAGRRHLRLLRRRPVAGHRAARAGARPGSSINHTPAVGQLESVLREHEPIGVLLADRQRARMFVFELGELVERSELFEELPRDIDGRGEPRPGRPRPGARGAATTSTSAHAAQVAFDGVEAAPVRPPGHRRARRPRRPARGRAAPVPARAAVRPAVRCR